jgi:protein-tyrosine phosphatase
MVEVQPWQHNPDARALVLQSTRVLSEGRLVVFPTDTGYVLSADARQPAAIEALRRAVPSENTLSLGVGNLGQVLDILPDLCPTACRLARRCWPGPVTLLCPDGAAAPLPADARIDGCLSLRSPAHSAILHVFHQLGGPLVLTPLGPPEQGLGELPDAIALAIDDGPCLYPQGATVVRVGNSSWEVVQEGVVPVDQLRVRMACLIVFVCTGNTCRSPMAEVFFKKRLAERLGCEPAELPQRGYVVMSAGLAAFPDDPAASPAVIVAREYGTDLSLHQSRPLDEELAVQADHLICMTHSHLQVLQSHFPYLSCIPRLLSAEGQDLPDPVGGDESLYRTCAARIWTDVEALVEELAFRGK